jgi:chloramphenicol-sensitive protein RarD
MELRAEQENRTGVIAAASAYVFWGFLPIYWKLLNNSAAPEILAHRVVWSVVFMLCILAYTQKLAFFRQEMRELAAQRKRVAGVIAASMLVSFNWLIYIWAVNESRIVETSLGYYINPLVSVLLGIVVLKERLSFWQWVSCALALAGVLIMTIRVGAIPWISLVLAVTFAFYGLCKKMVNLGAVTSITLETLLVSPAALAYLVYLEQSGTSSFSLIHWQTALLFMGSGVVTATPLLLFSYGANRLQLKMLGFLQYLAPTIALLIGVVVYGEPFTGIHILSFSCIWLALAVFSLAKTKPFIQMEAKLTKKTVYDC